MSSSSRFDYSHLNNSLVTLADLALNCSNNDRDHSYAVEKKPVAGVLDEECLVQKEKDHTYALSGRSKSSVNKTLHKHSYANNNNAVPRRSSSEENVSHSKHFVKKELGNPSGGVYWTSHKKSQSYEEILKQNTSSNHIGRDVHSSKKTNEKNALTPLSPSPVVKHLKIAGDLASPFLPRRYPRIDHTYAVVNSDSEMETTCDQETEEKKDPTSIFSPMTSTKFTVGLPSRRYSDHLYNKLSAPVAAENFSPENSNVIQTSDIPIWSRKSDHSYFTFDEPMREQMLGLMTNSKFLPHQKRDKFNPRSDHTYFSRA